MTQNLNSAGWGKLGFFDIDEHQIQTQEDKRVRLVWIPLLAAQWKIIYDFKPTEYWHGKHTTGLSVHLSSDDDLLELFVSFLPPKNFRLGVRDPNTSRTIIQVESNQLPKLQEWNRIEISHMEEGGRYFLSLSVGGNELGRRYTSRVHEFGRRELGRILPNDAGIYLFGSDMLNLPQPGFIRGLLVLDKQ